MYTYHLLSPASTPDALAHNEAVFAHEVLGLEVTVPALAARCSLGNIDPQHGEGGNESSSAVEVALTLPLPPAGAALATIRPDSDSLGAMAVLTLRAQGRTVDAELCHALGRVDAMGPRAYEQPLVKAHAAAVRAAVWQSLTGDVPLEARVAWMQRLLSGDLTPAEVADVAARSAREYEDARQRLQLTRLPGGRVALVVGASTRGLELGYASGVGIVACWAESYLRPGALVDEPPVAKWTIARRTPDEPIDLAGLRVVLNDLEKVHGGEPAWGGPANLLASPQGVASRIPPEHVLAAVLQHIQSSRDCGDVPSPTARPDSSETSRD